MTITIPDGFSSRHNIGGSKANLRLGSVVFLAKVHKDGKELKLNFVDKFMPRFSRGVHVNLNSN